MNPTEVTSVFIAALPASRANAKGWIHFNCPACGDRRARGGFIVKPDGGFRYHCFNGGCEFADGATGWDPGEGLGGRPRKLLRLLGGDVKDLPIELLIRRANRYTRDGRLLERSTELPVFNFPDMALPTNTLDLMTLPEGDIPEDFAMAYEARKYVLSRCESFIDETWFGWSPLYPVMIIVPYMHRGRTVGWMGRTFVGERKIIRKKHPDYLFNQEVLDDDDAAIILVEGEIDALSIMGVATCGPTLGKKQELLLQTSGRDVVVLPDFSLDGQNLIAIAERNGWYISTPDWDRYVKDATQAISKYGRIYTVASVMDARSKNYTLGRIRTQISKK